MDQMDGLKCFRASKQSRVADTGTSKGDRKCFGAQIENLFHFASLLNIVEVFLLCTKMFWTSSEQLLSVAVNQSTTTLSDVRMLDLCESIRTVWAKLGLV